jgi:hypothetical protein
MVDGLPAAAQKPKAAGTRAKVPEKSHQWGDHDEVGDWRKSSPLKGVSYSICLALAQIDFGDKVCHDRCADKNLSRERFHIF